MINVLQIRDRKHLFKSEESAKQFAEELGALVRSGTSTVILWDERVVGSCVPEDTAKEFITARMAKRLTEDPAQLKLLMERAQSSDLVDGDE